MQLCQYVYDAVGRRRLKVYPTGTTDESASGPTQQTQEYTGTTVRSYEYRRFELGAQPTWVALRFPGQYADAETGLFENWNRFYDPAVGRYAATDPMTPAANGSGLMPFAYASNNPLYNSDPTGLIIESDERGEALIQELSKTEEGKALVDYLASSELTYSIVAAAEAPANLPETAAGVTGNAPGETSYEGTIAGASDTQSKPVAGMAVRLFDSRVKALGVDPVGNRSHELGHTAMWDIARTGSAKYPKFLESFLKYTTPGRENGIEDMFVHNFLYSNAAADIPGRSCCR